MKKTLITLLSCLLISSAFGGNLLTETFEYGNHDLEKPIGWTCDDNTWLCGYLEKDHNRVPHSGNWYAFTDADEAWMFMPVYLISGIRYHFSCWAITDGQFDLSFWAGSAPDPEHMETLLLEGSVEGGNYERFTSYLETIPENSDIIGVRAVKHNGTFLTIDDIDIDMVVQYDFQAREISRDTVMIPGTQATFYYWVQNTGYDPLDIYMHASNEYFTNVQYDVNGSNSNVFPIEPNETVVVSATATLKPEIEPGSVTWLDIHLTIPCGCNTALVTFWVTPVSSIDAVVENEVPLGVFPNPAKDFVTIEAEGLTEVSLIDATGKTLSSHAAEGNSIRLDIRDLKPGIYFISAKTRSTSAFVKPILKM